MTSAWSSQGKLSCSFSSKTSLMTHEELTLFKVTCFSSFLSPVLGWSTTVRGTLVARPKATLCLQLWLETMGSSSGPPAVDSTSAASLGRPQRLKRKCTNSVKFASQLSLLSSRLTRVVCCVHQNSPGILSGGRAQADRSVQVPWTASRAAVWRRHAVQVAVWLKGQTVQPWFCEGEMFRLYLLAWFKAATIKNVYINDWSHDYLYVKGFTSNDEGRIIPTIDHQTNCVLCSYKEPNL